MSVVLLRDWSQPVLSSPVNTEVTVVLRIVDFILNLSRDWSQPVLENCIDLVVKSKSNSKYVIT